MIRLFGSVLLIAGGAGLGFSACSHLKARVRCLGALSGALGLMERELAFRKTPLPALLLLAGEGAPPSVAGFFARCRQGMNHLDCQGFYEIWDEALSQAPMPLEEDEVQTLREVGRVLGRYDAESQRTALVQAEGRMEQYTMRAQGEQERLGRVYGTLGMASGAFLILVLL